MSKKLFEGQEHNDLNLKIMQILGKGNIQSAQIKTSELNLIVRVVQVLASAPPWPGASHVRVNVTLTGSDLPQTAANSTT